MTEERHLSPDHFPRHMWREENSFIINSLVPDSPIEVYGPGSVEGPVKSTS